MGVPVSLSEVMNRPCRSGKSDSWPPAPGGPLPAEGLGQRGRPACLPFPLLGKGDPKRAVLAWTLPSPTLTRTRHGRHLALLHFHRKKASLAPAQSTGSRKVIEEKVCANVYGGAGEASGGCALPTFLLSLVSWPLLSLPLFPEELMETIWPQGLPSPFQLLLQEALPTPCHSLCPFGHSGLGFKDSTLCFVPECTLRHTDGAQ